MNYNVTQNFHSSHLMCEKGLSFYYRMAFGKCLSFTCVIIPFILFSLPASGSVSLSNTFTFSQNFDGLTTAGTFPTSGVTTAIPGGTGFDGAKIAGNGSSAMPFTVAAGSTAASGALYSFGTTTSSTDRALGTLASATNIGAFGVQIVNDSGSLLTGFTLTFNQEQYHNANSSGAVDNTVAFSYSTTAANGALTSTNYLSSTLIANSSGDLVSTLTSTSTTPNTTFVTTAKTVTITGISVDAGESIFLRWADANEAGSDAALGIDDLTFSAVAPVPEPTTVLGALLLVGAAVYSQCRRLRLACGGRSRAIAAA